MEEEMKNKPLPANPIKQSIPLKSNIQYSYAGGESLTDHLKQIIPKELIPSKRTGEYFGWIFLIVIILAFFQFPFGSLMSGRMDFVVGIGYPWHFLEFSLEEANKFPLKFGGLLLDLVLYILLAYSGDVATTLILKNPFIKSEEDLKKQPKILEVGKSKTIAEKITNQVIKKTEKTSAHY